MASLRPTRDWTSIRHQMAFTISAKTVFTASGHRTCERSGQQLSSASKLPVTNSFWFRDHYCRAPKKPNQGIVPCTGYDVAGQTQALTDALASYRAALHNDISVTTTKVTVVSNVPTELVAFKVSSPAFPSVGCYSHVIQPIRAKAGGSWPMAQRHHS